MVGLAAGGITDVTARLYAEAVSKSIGQRITVENKTGAGGGVAAAACRTRAPDGYTLLVFSGSQHATVPAVSNAPYDPVKGFSPITYLFNSRGGADGAGRQPGQDHGRVARLGPQEAGRLDRRHAGAGLAVAPARRQDIARRQGAGRDGALSRRRADDGRPRSPAASTWRGRRCPRRAPISPRTSCARWRSMPTRAGRRCRTCRRWSSSASPSERVASWFALADPPACRRRWSPRSATSSSRRRRTPSCKGG